MPQKPTQSPNETRQQQRSSQFFLLRSASHRSALGINYLTYSCSSTIMYSIISQLNVFSAGNEGNGERQGSILSKGQPTATGPASQEDELFAHMSCPECESSFDTDISLMSSTNVTAGGRHHLPFTCRSCMAYTRCFQCCSRLSLDCPNCSNDRGFDLAMPDRNVCRLLKALTIASEYRGKYSVGMHVERVSHSFVYHLFPIFATSNLSSFAVYTCLIL